MSEVSSNAKTRLFLQGVAKNARSRDRRGFKLRNTAHRRRFQSRNQLPSSLAAHIFSNQPPPAQVLTAKLIAPCCTGDGTFCNDRRTQRAPARFTGTSQS
jgi:hypothetical protein